jgi:hypothetical protein
MRVGDLVKRRGREWYALVIGFKDDLGTLPCGVELGRLPEGNRDFPIIMWITGDWLEVFGEVDSCSATLLEVVSTVQDHVADKRAALNP